MTGQTPFSAQLSAKLSCGLPIALLALSLTFGPSAVRAEPDVPRGGQQRLDRVIRSRDPVRARILFGARLAAPSDGNDAGMLLREGAWWAAPLGDVAGADKAPSYFHGFRLRWRESGGP